MDTSTLIQEVQKHGGRMVKGDTRFDGILYSFRCVWDCDEDADAFLESFPEGTLKSDRGFVGTYLTLFVTIVTPNN